MFTRVSCFLLTEARNITLENGYFKCQKTQKFPIAFVPATCNAGYELRGSSYVSCYLNGSWSGNTVCVIKGMYRFFI